MTKEDEFFKFEIAVDEFDLNQIPDETGSSATREVAIEQFFKDQLRSITSDYSVSIEDGIIRATWRKSSIKPDALDQAVEALSKGAYASGVQILEFLIPSRPGDAAVHYNLGMAYSDLGKLDKAVDHLSRALEIEKGLVNAKVALGVAYARQKSFDRSAEVLKEAVLEDPDNGYALRNLGAVLLQIGRDREDSLRYLRRAVSLMPEDQQAWFGVAQAELAAGDLEQADLALKKVIGIQPYNSIAESAKDMRTRIAQQNFRGSTKANIRLDAVMYILSAMRQFSEMSKEDVQKVGFEIATIGMGGIDVNDPKSQYHLRTLPGTFSGLGLLCYEYAAFKQFAPELDIGFDLSKEYEEAERLKSLGS